MTGRAASSALVETWRDTREAWCRNDWQLPHSIEKPRNAVEMSRGNVMALGDDAKATRPTRMPGLLAGLKMPEAADAWEVTVPEPLRARHGRRVTANSWLQTTDPTPDAGESRLDTTDTIPDTGMGWLDTADTKPDAGKGRLDTADTIPDAGKGRLDTADTKPDAGEGRLDTVHTTLDAGKGGLDTVDTIPDAGKGGLDTTETAPDAVSIPPDAAHAAPVTAIHSECGRLGRWALG